MSTRFKTLPRPATEPRHRRAGRAGHAAFVALALAAASLLLASAPEAAAPDAASAPEASAMPAAPATPAAPAGGRIEGLVRHVGTAPLRVKQLTNTIDVATCGERLALETVVLGEGRTVGNVFVELRRDDGGLLPPAPPAGEDLATVTIKRCALEPHVLVVAAGSEVEIQNADGILHHLLAPALRNEPFEAALPRYRKRLRLPASTLHRPEILQVSCIQHPWEVGWWVVSDNPLRALTGRDGRFVIEGVPAGKWLVSAWHEDLGRLEQEITVSGNETVTVELPYR